MEGAAGGSDELGRMGSGALMMIARGITRQLTDRLEVDAEFCQNMMIILFTKTRRKQGQRSLRTAGIQLQIKKNTIRNKSDVPMKQQLIALFSSI